MKREEAFMVIYEKIGTKDIWNEEKINNYYKDGKKITSVVSCAESNNSSDILSWQRMFSYRNDFDMYNIVTRKIHTFTLTWQSEESDKKHFNRMSGCTNGTRIFTSMYFETPKCSVRLKIEVDAESSKHTKGFKETAELFELLSRNHENKLAIEYKDKFIEIPGNDH